MERGVLMKKEKIKQLFDNNSSESVWDDGQRKGFLYYEDFAHAINQAELEWYKKLEDRLLRMNCDVYRVISERLDEYIFGIQNKIKELEK